MHGLFAVYHRAPETYAKVYDGLFIVSAENGDEAYQIVGEKLGAYFEDAVVEPIAPPQVSKIVLEFWREVPRVNHRQKPEEAAV